MYKPVKNSLSMTTPALHQKPVYETINGREKKTFRNICVRKGYFKEKGGGEVEVGGVKIITKTITYTCRFSKQLEATDRLIIYGKQYEITNVEDVEMRHYYAVCELKYLGAGA